MKDGRASVGEVATSAPGAGRGALCRISHLILRVTLAESEVAHFSAEEDQAQRGQDLGERTAVRRSKKDLQCWGAGRQAISFWFPKRDPQSSLGLPCEPQSCSAVSDVLCPAPWHVFLTYCALANMEGTICGCFYSSPRYSGMFSPTLKSGDAHCGSSFLFQSHRHPPGSRLCAGNQRRSQQGRKDYGQ